MTTRQALLLGEGSLIARYSPLPMALNIASKTDSSNVSSIAGSLTPGVANTILVAIVVTRTTVGVGGAALTGVSDNHGLTWHNRNAQQFQATNQAVYSLEVWWAVASVAQAYTVTAAFTQSVGTAGACAIHLMAVSGVASSSSPWMGASPLGNIVTFGNDTSTSSFGSNSFSTTDANAFVFAFCGYNGLSAMTVGAIASPTATLVESTQNSPTNMGLISEYEVFTSLQTSITANFSTMQHYFLGWTEALAG